MRYMGGKKRMAPEIAGIINAIGGRLYVEPFMGALGVAPRVSIKEKLLSDVHPGLAELYEAIRGGWHPPQKDVTREEYAKIKAGPPGPLRTLVGFASSFSGRWWQGYAQPSPRAGRLLPASGEYLVSAIERLEGAKFVTSDYRDLKIRDGAVVYCDPPYAGAKPYPGVPRFDTEAFWRWAEGLSKRCVVLVSEFRAPSNWHTVWEKAVRNQAGAFGKQREERVMERVFRLKGGIQ